MNEHKMKLQEAPATICKVVKFPASVTSYFRIDSGQNEQHYDLKGGLLKDTQYAWLSWGPNFEVIRTTNCAKVAAWTFGAVLRHSKTRVTCVTELPCNDGSGRVSQFVVGLECELVGGMICVFDIRGSKVLRAVQMPSKVTSVNVVDCGSEGCYPLPQLLSSMTGVLAVGLAGGQIMLVDLCRINCDEGLSMGSCGDLRDELHACQLLPISVHETDQETLEYKRAHAARTGDHLCVVLNESFLADKMFLLPLPGGNTFSLPRRRVDVTALMYVPRIASIVAGFSFGSFQIWNLMQLTLEYMSPTMQDPLPVISFGFQEPCDDPRNFCYLWAVHSSCHRNRLPFAVMYALCYQSKEWVDGYGYLNQDFVSCVHRFDFDLEGGEGGVTIVGGNIVACYTINKLLPAVAKRDSPHADLDDCVQESDLTLCLFVWETWGANCPGSTRMALFDLNQWYKEQMPAKIVKGQASTYMTVLSLDKVVEASVTSANSTNPLLDVRVDPASLSQFTAVQSLEEHFYPSALAFESLSLLGEELVVVSHPGVQRDILSQLEQSGPSALVYPTKLFHHCVAIGLRPVYVELSTTFNCPLTEQREFLMSVALEYQLVGFLSRCAAEWVDGSQSAMGCTLSSLLKWGWQRATILKTHADNLCIPLYDYSGMKLDTNSYQLLDYCGNQLHHLTTLFQGVLKICKNPSVQGVGDLSHQARVLELVAVYIEVVEWFVNVGLLPEFPCEDLALVDDGYEAAGEFGAHRVPYPASALAKVYQRRRSELEKLSRSATDKTDILFIDGLVKRECNGDCLSSLWERDGGTGLYPPPSIQSLLRTYLLDGIPMHVKHSIVIYVFLDLAGLLESRRYTAAINQFIKFPSAFRLTPSFIKITQALWLLDHQDFTEAVDMLLDPLISMDDLKPWQHQCIIRAFLYQGQHQMALKYIRVQQPPLKDIEDIRLNLTVLLVNGLIHEAFQYQRQHCNEQNSRDLLQHFFSACQQMNQLSVVLQLALSPIEEESFIHFLQNCHNPWADDMRVMYYLERSRIAEAMEVNSSIRSSKSHVEPNSLKRGRTEDKPSCVRDTIVQAYAKTLPSVTRKLALYCAQEKSCFTNWKQVSQPTPMSVEVHRGELQPVRYKSSLIQATLEKARETWSHMIQSPVQSSTPAKRDRSSMENPSVEMTPFLCTPRAASDTSNFTRNVTAVVFPTLTYTSPKSDDDQGGSPVKRFRYSGHYSSPLGSAIASSRKRLDRYSNPDALSLLQTPHVRRRTPSSFSRLQEKQDLSSSNTVFTPQSILKVRKMVRCSVSPDNLSQVSFTGASATPELLEEEEEEVSEEKMQVSDEEVVQGRQIRFSLPSDEHPDKILTPEDITLPSVMRSASKKSILGVSPRKALTRIRHHGPVRFDNSIPENMISSSEMLQMASSSMIDLVEKDLSSVVSPLHDRVVKEHTSDSPLEGEGTGETSKNEQDNSKSEVCLQDSESVSMDDNSDVFHSLENSDRTVDSANHSVVDSADIQSECPLKKLRVDNADKGKDEIISTQVQPVEVKEQFTPSQSTTWKTETSIQNSVEDQETVPADAVEVRHLVVEQGSNLDAAEGLVQKSSEADMEEKEQSVTAEISGECGNEFQSGTEEMLKEEKKDVGILLDTTTYSGLSFEISKDMEQEEVAAAAVVTVSSSDGDVGIQDLSEESGDEKMPALVIESVTGNVEMFACSEDDQKEYQTLDPLIAESEAVLDEKEESTSENDQPDEVADVLPTKKKEYEMATGSCKEDSEQGHNDFLDEGQIVRPKIHATEIEDEEDIEEEEEDIEEEEEDIEEEEEDIEEEEEDIEEEEEEEEDIEDEDEDEEEEEEEGSFEDEEDLDGETVFERVVQQPKVGMAKKPPSDDEGSIVILDSDSEEEKIEQGKQSAAEGKHITESLSSKGESEGDEEECDEYEEEEDNEETSSRLDSGSDTEHVLDEYDIVTDEPKLSGEVHTSDDKIEEEGSHKKPTQVQTVSVAGMFKSNEPCVKGLIEKEPMDFETCINVNEISKYEQSQGKVSEVMELSCEEENAGDRTLVMDQHMMDFEVEISASHISKPKQTDDRNQRNTQISVENKVVLSEMKEESVTIPETAEVSTEDGKFVGEEHDLIVRQAKEQIDMEKLAQKDGDIAVQLTSTENIPRSLQQDGTDVMEITLIEEEVLHDRTVGSEVSNVCPQQAVQELDITRCRIKARKTSESSSPPVDKLQLSSDFEGRSQDVKPRKTSKRASSFPRDIIHVDENTESRDIKVYRDNKVTTEEQNIHSECEKGRIHSAIVEECSVQREKSQKTEPSEVEVDTLTSTTILVGVVDSNKTTGSKLNSKEGSFQHDIPTVDVDSHETGISKQSDRERAMQRDDEVIDEEVYGSKADELSSTAVSSEHHIVSGNVICKPRSRACSVQCEDVDSVTCERKSHKPSSRASPVQHEDVPSDEVETCERKVGKSGKRARSVQRDGAPSDEIGTHERKSCEPSSKGRSVERDSIRSDETEECETEVCKPRASSSQSEDVCFVEGMIHEGKVCKLASKASSVVCEDIPSAINSHDKKVHRPSSGANSVQLEDVHSDEIETCERKVRKPSSRAGSVQREDVHSEEIETCERKVRKPSSRAGSVKREDVHSEEIETCERKVRKPSSRAGSVQREDVHSEEIEVCERKVRKPSSRAGSVQREDVHSEEIEVCERKVRKPSSRAGSVQREDVHSEEIEVCERKARKPSSRAGSVQREEDVHSDETEVCERKVRKPSSRAGSVQREDVHSEEIEVCERKVRKPSSRAGSVQREDVHSEEIEVCERKVRKPSSRAGSVQREDVHSEEIEVCERKVRKPSSRAGSVQCEDIHSDETEVCERKVRKSSSRAGSVQREEDVHSDEIEACGKKVLRPRSRSGSVQHEDVHSDEIEACGIKVRRPSSRASSVQLEVSACETECGEGAIRKHKSRSGSIQREDVPIDESDDNKTEAHKFSNRGGSAQRQVVPTSEAESVKKGVRKPRAGSVHRNLEVIEEESHNTGVGKPDSGVNSAQYVDIPSEKADSGKCKVDEPEMADSVKCIDVTEEDSHYRPISRASSVDSRDVALAADFACNENRSPTASSVNSDASTVVREESAHWARRTRRSSARSRHSSASSRCSSAQGDEGIDVKDNRMHADRLSRAGLIQKNVILGAVHEASEEMIENTKETEVSSRGVPVDGTIVGVSTEGPHTNNSSEKVDNFGRKAKKKYSQAGPSHSNYDTNTGSTMEVKYSDLEDSNAKIEGSSISKIFRESKDIRGKIKKSNSSGNVHDAGSVKLDLTPTSGVHHGDLAAETDCKKEKTSKAICGAISVSALDDQGISDPSIPPNELFRFKSNIPSQPYRKARSEYEYPVLSNIESKRFTRSTLGISTRTTSADTGSVTDNSASTKKSRRSDIGSQRMGDSSCSERSSGSSVQWKRKACSPTRGDSLRTRQVIEEYTTNRRLTRHQRLVLERSLELTKSPLSQLRHRKLPSLPENSDDVESGEEDKSSSQISSAGTRSSRLRSRALCESPSPISQASTVHLPPTESPLRRAGMETRSSRKSLLKLQEETRSDSPSPTKSDASSYANSAASLPIRLGASPSSTHSEDVTLGRVRRRSFRQAQLAFRSMSDQGSVSGLPSGTKPRATSPGGSDSNVSSDAGSSHTSLTSAGSHMTRSVALRMGRSRSEGEIRCSPRLARLQEEEHCSASSSTSFRFSPPTLVGGTIKKEESLAVASTSPVPAFVFSPPQKQQPVPKLHRQNAPSQQSRAHTMALRGLHTITEESTPPSTPTNTSPLQASERETTPIAVKKSKKFKPTPSSKTPHTSSRHNAMTPMTNLEQRELVKCERLRQSVSMEPHRRYTAFKHRKLFKIRRNSKSD